MDEPVWVGRAVVLALHDEQLAEHGGSPGLRDSGLLDSALARPRNAFAYGEPDLADLAAAYGFGLARNHAFIDGNKRASLVVTELFLALNGFELEIDDSAEVRIWLELAARTIGEAELATIVREHMKPL